MGAVSFGSIKDAQLRDKILNEKAVKSVGPDMQVRVPSLQAVFLAQHHEKVMEFTPIRSIPAFGLEVGKTEPAEFVLLRLQPAARKIDPKELN